MKNLIKKELIGKKFINNQLTRKDIETIKDIRVTTSFTTNEIIKVEYVTSFIFCGQICYNYNVPCSTIMRSKFI